MDHTPNLFPLKVIVISLGILLGGALVFMLTLIARKAGGEMDSYHCADVTVHIGKHEPASILPQGDKVQVTLKGENTVLTFDRCRGALLNRFTVAP